MPFYDIHIFCCTNQRPEGHRLGSCAGRGADALRLYMKQKAKELGIGRLRVNMAGCLGQCAKGPVLVVYPQGTWYHYKCEQDVDRILKQHLLGGEIVDDLMLSEHA